MKFLNILAALSLVLFIGCGGESSEQEQSGSSPEAQEQEMASEDVRTIDIIGIDNMQFVMEEEAEGVTLGDPVGADKLPKLVSITARPGEQIHIRLATRSNLPASAMAHNWLLLTMDADVDAFANAALKARDNDYVPSDMTDQIIAQTGLAAGGETTEVTFTVPEEPGEYEFICTFPGHFTAGMRGTLTVEESDQAM
jgi:azurin